MPTNFKSRVTNKVKLDSHRFCLQNEVSCPYNSTILNTTFMCNNMKKLSGSIAHSALGRPDKSKGP